MKKATGATRQYIALALVLALGIVGGSALSQIGAASGSGNAIERRILRELIHSNHSLREIEFALDSPSNTNTEALEAIKHNTGALCEDSSNTFLCEK